MNRTEQIRQLSPGARGIYDLLVEMRQRGDKPFLMAPATTVDSSINTAYVELIAAGLVTEHHLHSNASRYELVRDWTP